MNLEKLALAEKYFLQRYPGGFNHPELQELSKKHKMEKITSLAQEQFSLDRFKISQDILDSMVKLVNSSSMVSLFEKPKFRDFIKSLSAEQKEVVVYGVKELLHGDERAGFETLIDIFKEEKLAKWTLITAIPAYYNPTKDVFVKPTTVKNVIKYFELDNLVYNSRPTYDFYAQYRESINYMKSHVSTQLAPHNAAFSGFLMMVMEGLS